MLLIKKKKWKCLIRYIIKTNICGNDIPVKNAIPVRNEEISPCNLSINLLKYH